MSLSTRFALLCGIAAFAWGCATSPLGRRQLIIFPEADMAQMGVAAYADLKTKVPTAASGRDSGYVSCVAGAITAVLEPGAGPAEWEVTLFEEDSANAFALPGGKIGVHTGLLEVARTQDQLATVVGHEVGHVIARHSNERMSRTSMTQLGASAAVAAIGGGVSPASRELIGALGGIGLQYGVVLPFSRTQEAEADLVGLVLMARAGFDPRASVALWRNMAAASGAAVPELMSTHPAPATRITELDKRIPEVMPLYEQARASGRRPACR